MTNERAGLRASNDFLTVTVTHVASGGWRVAWNDHVANEWWESYESLAVALVRAAALLFSPTGNFSFAEASEALFDQVAAGFLGARIEYDPRDLPFEAEDPETDDCPDHGEQVVTGHRATPGSDPYDVSELACGCDVINLGDGNVVIHQRAIMKS
jgi:hypothetical protein